MGLSGNSEQCRNLFASHAEITNGFKFKASELSEAIIFWIYTGGFAVLRDLLRIRAIVAVWLLPNESYQK